MRQTHTISYKIPPTFAQLAYDLGEFNHGAPTEASTRTRITFRVGLRGQVKSFTVVEDSDSDAKP